MQGYYRFDSTSGIATCAQKMLRSIAAAVNTQVFQSSVDGRTYLEAPVGDGDRTRVTNLLAACGLNCTFVGEISKPLPVAPLDFARTCYRLRENAEVRGEGEGLLAADELMSKASDVAELFAVGAAGEERLVWRCWTDENEPLFSDQRFCANYVDSQFWSAHVAHVAVQSSLQTDDLPF